MVEVKIETAMSKNQSFFDASSITQGKQQPILLSTLGIETRVEENNGVLWL